MALLLSLAALILCMELIIVERGAVWSSLCRCSEVLETKEAHGDVHVEIQAGFPATEGR